MGQIKTLIARSVVEHPPNNERFSIMKCFRSVVIGYRNITAELTTDVFFQCAEALRRLDRQRIKTFAFGSGNFIEAVNFSGLRAEFPGKEKLTLHRERDGSQVIGYRCLKARLPNREADEIRRVTTIAPASSDGFWHRLSRRLRICPKSDNPMLMDRFSVDLCENIHVHFQDIRFEFGREEFLLLWDATAELDLAKWRRLPYGEIVRTRLPETTEWDTRFQLEEQTEGHFHLHYRNLRIEFRSFEQIGLALRDGALFNVDSDYAARFIRGSNWKLLGIRAEPVCALKVIVYSESGSQAVPVERSPIYRALQEGDRKIYDDYAQIVRMHDPFCRYDWDKFQALLASIKAEGIKSESVLVVRGKDKIVYDGQHRVSIMRHLFGERAVVKVAHYAD